MPQLRFIDLKCNKTEDFTGPDEAYLRVNGVVVWGPVSLNNGQVANLASVASVPFFGLASVELFDQDVGGIFDPDDFLGAIAVNSSQAGLGTQVGTFTGDEANYVLYYQVLA